MTAEFRWGPGAALGGALVLGWSSAALGCAAELGWSLGCAAELDWAPTTELLAGWSVPMPLAAAEGAVCCSTADWKGGRLVLWRGSFAAGASEDAAAWDGEGETQERAREQADG